MSVLRRKFNGCFHQIDTESGRDMKDIGGVGPMSSFNQSSLTSKMNTSNSTEGDEVETSGHVFFITVYSLVFLVGFLLNSFILKVYFCRGQQQTTSSVTVYLRHLAASDLLIGLSLPIRIANHARPSAAVHYIYCNFGASVFYLNMYASILFMGYIAANRYLKIVHRHILQTVRAARIISAATWLFLLVLTSSYISVSLLTQNLNTFGPITLSCDDKHSEETKLFYKVIHSVCATIFLLVLFSLVFFYCGISRRLSRAQRNKMASSTSKKLIRSRKNMLVLVSVFCICFIPYHLVRIPYAFLRGQSSWSQMFFYLKELTVMVSLLNICLDPLIYYFFCKAFRAQLNMTRMYSTTQVTQPAES